MRKSLYFAIILTVILSVLLLTSCSSQNQDSNVNGAMVEVKDDDGNLTGYERRYLNDEGNITRLDQYDVNQEYQSFVLYDYYDDGLLFTETFYRADGIAESRIAYVYDDDGNLYEKSYEYPHGDALTERYNTDGKLVEKFHYGEDEKLFQHDVLEKGVWISYDPDGNVIK